MKLLEIISKYGWYVLVLAFIGCVLVGVIKTPINRAIKKKLEVTEASEEKKKRVNAIYDALVYLGTYVIAALLAVGFNYIFKRGLSILDMLNLSLQIWLLQNTFYGIWRKLGLKKILCLIGAGIAKLFKKNLDKDGDGKISADEISGAVQGVMSDGKVDANKLFGKVTSQIPNLVLDVVTEAATEADEKISNDTEAAKKELTSKVIDLTQNKIKF